MRLYGTEYAIIPLLSIAYFYFIGDFSVPATFFNNAFVTAANALAAMWRSRQLAKALGPCHDRDRIEPFWPAFAALVLLYLAALQVILSVAHLSYYRTGPLVADIFER